MRFKHVMIDHYVASPKLEDLKIGPFQPLDIKIVLESNIYTKEQTAAEWNVDLLTSVVLKLI